MGKVIKKIVITLLVIALVAGGIYGGLIVYRNANMKPVKVFSVSDFSTENTWTGRSYTYGFVTTDKLQKVYASDTQTITEIYVSEGQEVKAGDPLLSYDTTLSDIDLEKAKISFQKLQRSYDTAKKEIEVIAQLRPHQTVVIKATPIEIVYVEEETPQVLSGTGTFDDPFYVLFSYEDALTDEMIEELYEKRLLILEEEKKKQEEEEPSEEPGDTEEGDPEEGDDPAEGELVPFPRDTEETSGETEAPGESEPEEPGEPGDSEEDEPGESDPEESGDPEESDPEEEEPEEPVSFCAAFVTRDQNALNGMVTSEWGLEIEKSAEEESFRYRYYYPMLPPEVYEYEEQPEDVWLEYGSDYSAEEIAEMKKAKEEEIKGLEDQIRLAKVDLDRLEQEISDSRVYAKIDGTVKGLNDPDYCRYSGEPVLELSAGGGYYIEVSMGEYELDTMKIGQTVTVNSWQTGTEVEGVVCAIGTNPVENDGSFSAGSQNVSYYPFTVFVDESANLMENDYVDVSYYSGASGSEDSWYLENIMIRTEGGKSYVYKKGEDGLLVKQIIQTGKGLDGWYTEIRGGLSREDRVAFPYGKDVKEGALTEDGTMDDYYNMY